MNIKNDANSASFYVNRKFYENITKTPPCVDSMVGLDVETYGHVETHGRASLRLCGFTWLCGPSWLYGFMRLYVST